MTRADAGKLGLAVAILVIAGGIWLLTAGGKDKSERTAFFYDLSEKKLYDAPGDAFAPIEGIGGESGDGVEAIVVYCPKCGLDNKRIAYLKTHSLEYKRKKEEAAAASGTIEGLTRSWVAENTLVSLVDPVEWHKATSEEGARIARDGRRRCPQHGEWERSYRP
jgi:hypothetical protein